MTVTAVATWPRGTGHSGYRLTTLRKPETARHTRDLAHAALAGWGLDSAAETAALVLCELVTNAVRHAQGPLVRITVDRPADDRVRFTVTDRTPCKLPELGMPGPDDVCGRGLPLVDQCTERWGCDLLGPDRKPWGKRVWAELKVSP